MSSDTPRDWRIATLGRVTDNHDARRIPVRAQDRRSGPYPYYGASGVVDYVDEFIFDGLHLLVAEDGENLRSRNKPIAFLADGRFWVNNHAHVLTGRAGIAATRYLSYLLQKIDLNSYISGSTRPKLTKRALDSVRIALPPLDEQRRIVRVLGALGDKIEHNERACSSLEEIGRLAYRRAMARSSENVPLAEVIDVNPKRPLPNGTSAPYLEMGNMPTEGHFPFGWIDREAGSGTRFTNGDTLVARITPCLENGKVAFVDFLNDGTVGWGSTEYIVLRPKPPLPLQFAYFLARDNEFREYAVRHMSGSSGRQRVSASAIADYVVRVPRAAERASLSRILDSSLSAIRALRGESRTLSAIQSALLPKLVSGAIRVPDSYDPDDALGSAADAAGVAVP